MPNNFQICISDGDDTKSATNKPDEICYRLREAKIAVDTIALGNEDNGKLLMPAVLGDLRSLRQLALHCASA
jgi:hypothetical protein